MPPGDLISLAEEWLHGQQRASTELTALIISTAVPLTWETLRPVVDAALPSGDTIAVLAIEPMSTIASVLIGELAGHGVALSIAGKSGRPPGRDPDAQPAQPDQDPRRGLSELAWAGVTASGQSTDLIMPDLMAWGREDPGPCGTRYCRKPSCGGWAGHRQTLRSCRTAGSSSLSASRSNGYLATPSVTPSSLKRGESLGPMILSHKVADDGPRCRGLD